MMALRAAAAAVLALAATAPFSRAARVAGSPFPVGTAGLNASAHSQLYVFDTTGATPDDILTVTTLQGVLAQRQPRIIRVDGGDAGLWANITSQMWNVTLNYTFARDAGGLLELFAPDVRAYVLVSLTDGSANAGIAAGASWRAVAVTSANEQKAVQAGIESRGNTYGWTMQQVVATFNDTSDGFVFNRALNVLQQPSKVTGGISDYAIATRSLQWWDDDVNSAEARVVWNSMVPPCMTMGWGPDELTTVTAASAVGGAVVASDWASNLDALSGFDLPGFTQTGLAPPPARAAAAAPTPPTPVHTVTLLMSDGDNAAFALNSLATGAAWFGSPDRGHVPMGWTLSPALADLAPAVMHYMYEAATVPRTAASGGAPAAYGDVFVAGVSGAGYFYPDAVPVTKLSGLVNLTSGYMAKADMRIVNVMSHGNGVTQAAADAYTAEAQVDALLWYDYSNYAGEGGAITWSNGKPVIGGRFSLWGSGAAPDPTGPSFKNVTGLIAALLAQPRTPGVAAGYSLVPVHAWTHNVTDARAVFDALAAQSGGGVEVVTPDVFVARVVANVAR